jgi:hypothetical protein
VTSADDYFTEIEGHFAIRRGTPFVLSAKDWLLMKKWREDGVPLPVVIEAIDSVFEKNESSGRKKVISSLSYCRHAVKELWEERRELQVGGEEILPEEDPAAVLEALAAELEVSSSEPARAFAPQIRELAVGKSVPGIEERLIALEHAMIETIVASLPADDANALRERVVRSIGDSSKLDEKTRARTEEANLRRLVRDRFALPRLTLFR